MQHFWWSSFYFLKRNSLYVGPFKLFVLHSYYTQKHIGTIIIYCFNNLQHKKGMLAGSSFYTPPKNQWNHFLPLKRTVGNHLSLNNNDNNIIIHCRWLECHFFVLTTFWLRLWSLTDRMHSNIESICYLNTMTGVHVYSKLHSCPKMTYCSKHKEVISKFIL